MAATLLRDRDDYRFYSSLEDIRDLYERSLPGRLENLASEGVTDEELVEWWARPEWVRHYSVRLLQLERSLMRKEFEEVLDDFDEVERHLRQNLATYSAYSSSLPSSDSPLPWELYERTQWFLAITYEAGGLGEEGNGITSLNALLRAKIASGSLQPRSTTPQWLHEWRAAKLGERSA